MWIINCYKSDIGRAFSGQVLDNILQAENERLTEERNQLQLNIRQMEDKISTLEGQITAAVTTVFTAAADVLLLIMMTTYNHHHHHYVQRSSSSLYRRLRYRNCLNYITLHYITPPPPPPLSLRVRPGPRRGLLVRKIMQAIRLGGVVVSVLDFRQQVAGSNPSRCAFRCNPGQVVHIHVPLSPSSVIWYRPVGGDARRLAR